MMSQRAVAKALGISRTWVMAIERRALNKLLVGLGEEPIPEPPWLKRLGGNSSRGLRCHNCGEMGHNAQGCIGPSRVMEKRDGRMVNGKWKHGKVVLVPFKDRAHYDRRRKRADST
jgi:hypothetical protein